MTAVILFTVGAFGGLVKLSNIWTTPMPAPGGSYYEGIVGAPRFINPVLANSDADRDMTALAYSGLVRMDANGNYIPDLAQSWTVSPDGKTYVVTLKPNLTFHDHKKLTADDVVFTIEKIQDPVLKSPLHVAWDGVTAVATDAQTVTFNLQKPYAGFLVQWTVGIIPKHIWEKIPDASWSMDQHNTEPIGSGPYRIQSVARSNVGVPETFKMNAFKKFALGKPYLHHIIIKCFANKDDAYHAFDAGKIDGLSSVDSKSVATISDNSTDVVTAPLPRVFGLFLNPSKNKLFADPAIVKALNIAINKPAIIDAIFSGYAHPLSGPLPEMLDENTGDYTAKKLLAEKTLDTAGWKLNPETNIREKTTVSGKTKNSQMLSFTISTANTPELEESAQLIADQLGQIGVHVEVKVFEIGTLNEHVIRGRDFESLLFGEIIHHDTDLYAFWHSSQKSDPGLNITGYASTHVDQLLESALKESDATKRFALYNQIQSELAKNGSVVFLYAPDFIYLVDSHFHNIVTPPIVNTSTRFSLVYQWYHDTNRVWNLFVKK